MAPFFGQQKKQKQLSAILIAHADFGASFGGVVFLGEKKPASFADIVTAGLSTYGCFQK